MPRAVGSGRLRRHHFASEDQLVRAAIEQSGWSSGGRDSLTGVIREISTPTGMTDLLFYRLRQDWQQHALLGGVHSRWAFAFRCLPYRRVFDSHYAATLFGVSERTAKVALTSFVALGLCRPAKRGANWIKTRELVPPAIELIAVEAKLRDWRKALSQAAGNLAFADHSWVLLDARTTSAALRQPDLFRSRGVGLACLSRSGELNIKIRAQQSDRTRAHDRQFVNCELIKRLTFS